MVINIATMSYAMKLAVFLSLNGNMFSLLPLRSIYVSCVCGLGCHERPQKENSHINYLKIILLNNPTAT